MAFAFPRPGSLFLFDLDGTLVDSKQDIALSVNLCLQRMGFRDLPVARVARLVGDGVQKLLERALAEVMDRNPAQEDVRRAVGVFLQEYGDHLLDTTRLYPGVREALDSLHWARFGIVTNKPEELTLRLLEGLGLEGRFCAILGGDSTRRRKPDPEPLLEAMNRCQAPPHLTVMVGDSPVDVNAGRAAAVFTCGVAGGFRGARDLEEAGCDLIIARVSELPRYFRAP